MSIFLLLCAYAVYALFWGRLMFSVFSWYRIADRLRRGHLPPADLSCSVCAGGALDVLTFRRLLIANGWLWLGSWTFHLSFFLVIMRHLRFAMDPVPKCITFLQFPGLVAGYLLPASVVVIALARIGGKEKYVSWKNTLLVAQVFVIAATGLLMRFFFRIDTVAAKEFIFGIFTFTPAAIPDSFLFVVHFSLVILLVPFLPSHILAAPLVLFEARRREKGLAEIIHEYEARRGSDLGRKA
jgi:nitrate reductase gamma subunit